VIVKQLPARIRQAQYIHNECNYNYLHSAAHVSLIHVFRNWSCISI
jgi:hypothetical protein